MRKWLIGLWLLTGAALFFVSWNAYFVEKGRNQALGEQVQEACDTGLVKLGFTEADEKALCDKADEIVDDEPAFQIGPEGKQGPPGPQGPIGPSGPQGFTGTQGNPGQKGVAGTPGQPGTPGMMGDQGSTGPPGTSGADGKDGTDGAPGEQGLMGPEGPQGPPGECPPGTTWQEKTFESGESVINNDTFTAWVCAIPPP